jgi:hypothetical protein
MGIIDPFGTLKVTVGSQCFSGKPLFFRFFFEKDATSSRSKNAGRGE